MNSGVITRKHRRVSLENDTIDPSSNSSLPSDPNASDSSDGGCNQTSFKRRRVSLDPLLDLVPSEPSTTGTVSIQPTESNHHATTSHSTNCDSSKIVTRPAIITPSPSTMSIYPPESSGEMFHQSPPSAGLSRCETPEHSLGLEWDMDDALVAPTCSPVDKKIVLSRTNVTNCTRWDSTSSQSSCNDSQLSDHSSPDTMGESTKNHVKIIMSYLKQSRITWREVMNDVLLLSLVLLGIVVLGQGVSIAAQLFSRLQLSGNDCIYVSGGGFSGFWFSLGRLHSIPKQEMTKQRFACYSAGCLGVVSVYTNRTMPDLYAMASGLQRDWKEGSLHRYHIVQHFVDNLLEGQDFDEDMLSSLHILTSIPQKPMGFRAVLNTPTNMEELKTMLMQTTWIPVAVGSEFTYEGHLDGAFSAMQHPTCHKKVGLANDLTLLTNTLNVNLGKDLVEQFWQLGLDYGI